MAKKATVNYPDGSAVRYDTAKAFNAELKRATAAGEMTKKQARENRKAAGVSNGK